MFARFTPAARRAVVHAGRLATEAGRKALDTDHLLLALTVTGGVDSPLARSGVTTAAVQAEIDRRQGAPTRPDDRQLLATLGIDLDEVRRRAAATTSTSLDDPSLWRLHRSVTRPLLITLTGPTTDLPLRGHARKVMEVALWVRARARRPLVTPDDLLWGLLSDRSNEAARILSHLDVDYRRLWTELRAGCMTA